MINLHRLGQYGECFQLNPDLIVSIESTPDTVITLATSAKVVVADSPEEIAAAVRDWRAEVLGAALDASPSQRDVTPLRSVAGRPDLTAIEGGW
jgi:flagellar protein FlbD